MVIDGGDDEQRDAGGEPLAEATDERCVLVGSEPTRDLDAVEDAVTRGEVTEGVRDGVVAAVHPARGPVVEENVVDDQHLQGGDAGLRAGVQELEARRETREFRCPG